MHRCREQRQRYRDHHHFTVYTKLIGSARVCQGYTECTQLKQGESLEVDLKTECFK